MNKLEEILTGIPQEIKTLEVDTEKKIFKLNGINFGKGCEEFMISCTGGTFKTYYLCQLRNRQYVRKRTRSNRKNYGINWEIN